MGTLALLVGLGLLGMSAVFLPGAFDSDQLRDPVLAVLAVGIGVGYVYGAALAFLTPQNEVIRWSTS